MHLRRPPHPVLTGLDVLVGDTPLQQRLRGQRIGLLANQAAVTRDFEHALWVLPRIGLPLARLFGPEHGLWGHAQDMDPVGHARDPVTGIETVSLYTSSPDDLTPAQDALRGLDVVLIDLPDIGTRYYTFAATAYYLAQVATGLGLAVWVLDRPNPLGGLLWEGNFIEPGFESFVGAIPVPNRHALTLAELLRYAGQHGPHPVRIEVVPVQGWNAALWLDETDAPWVMPSPNMPTLDTAIVYTGMCLLEATNVSEGRGTTRPFEIFGAPWVNASQLAATLTALSLAGVTFRPLAFQPAFQKWGRELCQGVQLHVHDRTTFAPYRTGLAVVHALRTLYPDHFAWRAKPYEFIDHIPAIDLLCGTDRVRTLLDAGADLASVWREAERGSEAFAERQAAVALYPRETPH